MDLISVIIPVYKVEEYLDKCVESVVNQTYKNLEIILIDDGSPDNCPKMCDEWAKKDDRIKVIHKKNGGVSSAKNMGLDIAKGKYISFIDSDDFISLDMYEKMISKIKSEDCHIVISYYNVIKDGITIRCKEEDIPQFCETKDIKFLLNKPKSKLKNNSNHIRHGLSCYLWRMLFLRDILKNIRFNNDVRLMEDTLFFIELVKNKDIEITYIEEYLYFYLYRNDSAVHKTGPILDNHIKLYNRLKAILPESEYKELLMHYQFYLYVDCFTRKHASGVDEDLTLISEWNTKENYRASNRHVFKFIARLKNFFAYHNMHKIYKFLRHIRGR